MRIMAISDTESTALWDHYNSNKITDTDLILSCGDLNPNYLSFLVSCTNLPLLYVHGNHDEKYDQTPPEGCICIDDKIYVHEGIRILGLGGCMPYKPGKYMYTEKEMKRRLLHIKHQLIFYHGFDILLTHAPAQGLGDGDDHAHQGYEVFLKLLNKYQPKYMVHLGGLKFTFQFLIGTPGILSRSLTIAPREKIPGVLHLLYEISKFLRHPDLRSHTCI